MHGKVKSKKKEPKKRENLHFIISRNYYIADAILVEWKNRNIIRIKRKLHTKCHFLSQFSPLLGKLNLSSSTKLV